MTADGMVETWEEFVDAVNNNATDSSNVRNVICKPGLTFDMNDYYPEGMPNKLFVSNGPAKVIIYGNGLVWRNIMLKSPSYSESLFHETYGTGWYFYDIVFENLVSYGMSFIRGSYNSSNIRFYGCKIIGELYGKTTEALMHASNGFSINAHNDKGSLIDFKFLGAQPLFTRSSTPRTFIYDSRLIFDESLAYYMSTTYNSCGYILQNSVIEGHLIQPYSFEMGSSTDATFASIINASHDNGVIDFYSSPTGTEKLVINIDKNRDENPSYGGYDNKLILATTEQLKDAEFLRSKGFPIGR